MSVREHRATGAPSEDVDIDGARAAARERAQSPVRPPTGGAGVLGYSDGNPMSSNERRNSTLIGRSRLRPPGSGRTNQRL